MILVWTRNIRNSVVFTPPFGLIVEKAKFTSARNPFCEKRDLESWVGAMWTLGSRRALFSFPKIRPLPLANHFLLDYLPTLSSKTSTEVVIV